MNELDKSVETIQQEIDNYNYIMAENGKDLSTEVQIMLEAVKFLRKDKHKLQEENGDLRYVLKTYK